LQVVFFGCAGFFRTFSVDVFALPGDRNVSGEKLVILRIPIRIPCGRAAMCIHEKEKNHYPDEKKQQKQKQKQKQKQIIDDRSTCWSGQRGAALKRHSRSDANINLRQPGRRLRSDIGGFGHGPRVGSCEITSRGVSCA
jgi:hypothetical protein